MRTIFRSVVVPCALLALACQGAKGDKGDTGATGPQGPPGNTGPAGTFSGTFTGDAGIVGSLTVNGQDLFTASMQGTAPAVIGYPLGFALGHLNCAAPASLDFSGGTASAAYGEIMYTTRGAFNFSQSVGPNVTTCTTACLGPITFFLNSPSAQTIVLQGFVDNGPSRVYIDGVAQNPTLSGTISQGVNVPQGPFALSLVACSSDGLSIAFNITNQWINTPPANLTIDFDRTFHRNGQ